MASPPGDPNSRHGMGRIASVLAVASLLPFFAGVAANFVGARWEPNWQVVLILVMASPVPALVAVILGVRARRSKPGIIGLALGCISLVTFLAVALIAASLRQEPDPHTLASAVASLRTINAAEVEYASTYDKGFSPDLASLGPPGSGGPSSSAAGLIDGALASGHKRWFVFTYIPGPRDDRGKIMTYEVLAQPSEYDPDKPARRRGFFTDETGVIRWTDEPRRPNKYDEALR